MVNMGTSEKIIKGVGCCEHPAPQENLRPTDTETEGDSYYDTKTPSVKEEKSDAPEENVRSRILEAARVLFSQPQVIELRAIFKNGRVDSGYFDDLSLLTDAAATLDKRADVTGVYWTLNPVNPDCLHRAKNHVCEWISKSKGGATTSDKEILERRFILLDFDGAKRPAGISATKEELRAAKRKAIQTAKFLSTKGWDSTIAAMSGNGYHLLYRTKLPNDQRSAELVKKLLVSLSLLFDDDEVKVDTSVFNASRICKVYGTIARKGDDTLERRHRRSVLLKAAGERHDNV
jgi:hypothetical protein